LGNSLRDSLGGKSLNVSGSKSSHSSDSQTENRPSLTALDAQFCPICGAKLHVDGERLLCDRHGEMNVYLDRDPYKAAQIKGLKVICSNCKAFCILDEKTVTGVKLTDGTTFQAYDDKCWQCGKKFPKIEKDPKAAKLDLGVENLEAP
jgi:NAD-dependent dihydropyrimidine dehydrogenase PreA subunit